MWNFLPVVVIVSCFKDPPETGGPGGRVHLLIGDAGTLDMLNMPVQKEHRGIVVMGVFSTIGLT